MVENKAVADGDNFGSEESNTVELTINPLSGGGGTPTGPTITKSASNTSVVAGQEITYTIEVENDSSDTLVDAAVRDILDQNLEFVSANPPPTTNTTVLGVTTLTWEIGDLGVGEKFTIELKVEVKSGTVSGTIIENDAELSADQFNPITAGAPDVEVTSPPSGGGSGGGGSGGGAIMPPPNYEANMEFVFADPKVKGEDYGESVTITNTGSIALSPGDLTVTFPLSLNVVTLSPSAISFAGNVATWSVPVIPVGGSYTVSFTVKPNATGTNIITVANYYIGTQQIAVASASENVGDVAGETAPELPRTGAGAAYLLLVNLPLLFMRRLKKALAALFLLAAGFLALNFSYFKEVVSFSLNKQRQEQEQLLVEEELPPNTLTVPSLGIMVPIILDSGSSESEFQEALRNGVVHYPGTAQVGQAGNSYIFGHSSDYFWSRGNYKTVFAVLPKINIGDEVMATDAEGQEYFYQVKETKVVGPSDLSVLEQDYTKKRLTLQTSYPIGTALKRFIVIAELKEE
ncbi:MAG: sortase [Candidatus Doudnabacteria bacterium]|nr:sortase [Candidatus Doudnabacteria bacterium]